ncbi:viral A-type inclusion protein [Enterococcus saccharolyticus]|uniref:Viral A-type inclusion protein n=1 Tax=Candidatus Enterococcus willemsii TaxID=1857215 RepID=A0ABQ6Z2H7_9ENTE|nr:MULTISPECIES: viral A-type inclusion protein [Enterococcus]KAF1305997.1 viral A-type inclusion protein [Enterococcus sp. CU12B]MCD5003253.1 viral A-type inclusion protein [Enterococcus saccharolyticus]
MSEDLHQENQYEETSNLGANFEEIKEVASKNIGSMLKDLHAFEEAIEKEDIPEIYRIYKGRLHKELKETSNQNHEIDELLSKKLHDNFVAAFPFMQHVEKISHTIHYYKISSYYRERITIGFDASIPEIFVLPQIDEEWHHFQPDNREALDAIEKEIDNLDANFIAAEMELAAVQKELKEIENQKAAIHNNKSFFNRTKIEEDLESIEKKEIELKKKRDKWLPFIENKEQTNRQKDQLMQSYQETRLKRAVVAKEFRLINKYFGSIESMGQQLNDFLKTYLAPEKGAIDNE